MSLYDGISVETAPVPEMAPKSDTENKSISGWSSGHKLMASQLQRNKKALRATQQPKTKPAPSAAVLESTKTQKPVAPLHDLPKVKELLEDDLAIEIQDEYDPLVPNSYEKISLERRSKQEKIREEERKRRHEERDRGREDRKKRRHSDSSGSESEDDRRSRRNRRKDAAAIPPPPNMAVPPPSSLTNTPEEKQNTEDKPVVQSALQELSKKKAKKANPFGKPKFGSFASKIMSKYGWEEGKGLGKASQGISTALTVEKTSKRGGKIVNMAAEQEQQFEQEKKKAQSLADALKNPCKVVLLQNMVGPGDVDGDLEPEVAEECAKYGEVSKVLIFEIPNGVPEEEAVRIFVEFTRKESAIKAVIDLNGRFFGGRTIKAGFYSEEKFAKFDLAP